MKSAENARVKSEEIIEEVEDEAKALMRLLKAGLGKILLFICFAMPAVFITCMALGGFVMAYDHEWTFRRGFDFMASAITGGAIVFPVEHPTSFRQRVLATFGASLGIGLFGLSVAILGNSLSAPIIQVLGVGVVKYKPGEAKHHIFRIARKLTLVASLMTGANLVFGVIFGSILAFMQGWSVIQGAKLIASVELGGGISFVDMGDTGDMSTVAEQLLYVTIGIWAIGMASLMVAIAGDPCHTILGHMMGFDLEEGTTAQQAYKMLAVIVFVALPVTLLLTMGLVALIMDRLTVWKVENAFWTALPAITGGAASLHDYEHPPLGLAGGIILVIAASFGWFVVSSMMGVGGELIGPILEQGPVLGKLLGKEGTVFHSIGALFIISFLLIPSLVWATSIIPGYVMAVADDWPFLDGFWWTVSIQLGGGMSLTKESVTTFAGRFVGAIIVGWGIGISILAIGVSGAPIVEPLMDKLGMKISAEDLAKIGHRKSNGTRQDKRGEVAKEGSDATTYGTSA